MILWSDTDLIVVNKPAGIRTIQDGYHPDFPTLVGTLQPEWGKLWVVHRLDKDTSGVMVFARTAETHRNLNLQFERRQVQKIYHAMVIGNPSWSELAIHSPLKVNGDRRHRTVVDPINGKPALTEVKVIRRFGGFCLVEAAPHSGYTHQIRTHLSSAGFPLAGDSLYRHIDTPQTTNPLKESGLAINRTALHAFSIRFNHPLTGAPLAFEAPYPDDFQDLLNSLA